MPPTTSFSQLLLPLVLVVTVQVGVAVGLFLWARWVGRRRSARWWRGIAFLPLAGLALALIGAVISVVFLSRGYGAIHVGDPSTKATRLAENIAYALNVTAFFVIPAKVFYVVSFFVSLVGSLLKSTQDAR